ncbi:MAG: lamin tail domain-containing protein [Bacteroidales bacterium]|nr:lamin tail domain-containing protein [Bacteroidales bacterium]
MIQRTITALLFLMVSLPLMEGCSEDTEPATIPLLTNLQVTPRIPSAGESAIVSVSASDESGIMSVLLFYSFNQGTFQSFPTDHSGDKYTGIIPGQPVNTIVSYYIEAKNNSGNMAYLPDGAPTVPASYIVGAPDVVLNEIYSQGTSQAPDWIEIFNLSDTQANISDYSIYDDGGYSGSRPKKKFPSGTIIPAKGFIYIIVDDNSPDGSGFGLIAEGEKVWLENQQGSVIDAIEFPFLSENQSYGRYPDGTGNWRILDYVTKGTANIESPPVSEIIVKWDFDQDGDLTPEIGSGSVILVGGVVEVSQDSSLRITDFPGQFEYSGEAGLELMFSTVGFDFISFEFKQRASGTASRWAEILYTPDGGGLWRKAFNNNGGLSPHDLFYTFTFDLGQVTEANNNPDFGLRIVSIFSPVAFDDGLGENYGADEAYHRARTIDGNPYSPGGNWRFKEVIIKGIPLKK